MQSGFKTRPPDHFKRKTYRQHKAYETALLHGLPFWVYLKKEAE